MVSVRHYTCDDSLCGATPASFVSTGPDPGFKFDVRGLACKQRVITNNNVFASTIFTRPILLARV